MITQATNLKTIRIDKTNEYDGQIVLVKEVQRVEYLLGYSKQLNTHLLTLKIRLNYLDSINNTEVVGYLGEKTASILPTTKDTDKQSLLTFLSNTLMNVNYMLQNQFPDFKLLKSKDVDLNVLADKIQDDMVTLGLYRPSL